MLQCHLWTIKWTILRCSADHTCLPWSHSNHLVRSSATCALPLLHHSLPDVLWGRGCVLCWLCCDWCAVTQWTIYSNAAHLRLTSDDCPDNANDARHLITRELQRQRGAAPTCWFLLTVQLYIIIKHETLTMMIAGDHNGAIWSTVFPSHGPGPHQWALCLLSLHSWRDLPCPLPPALLILLNCCLIIASPSPGHSPGNITWHGTGSLCLHIGICVGYNLESHVAEISDIFSCIPHQIFTLHVQCTHCQFEQVMDTLHNTYKSS